MTATRPIPVRAGLVCAALLSLAWVGCDRTGPGEPTRPLEARLTGGFAYAECRPSGGAFTCAGNTSGQKAVSIWSDVSEVPAAGDPAAEMTRRATVMPLLGASDAESLERVIRQLERQVSRFPASADHWNDYGAVLWARHQASGDGLDAFQALEATDRALALAPDHAESAFNRALLTERLGFRSVALESWDRAAELEIDADWLLEIQQRRANLQRESTAELRWTRLMGADPETTAPYPDLRAEFPWRSRQHLLHYFLPSLAADVDRGAEDVRPLAAALARRGDPLIQDALDAWPASNDGALRLGIQELGRGMQLLEELELAEATASVERARKALSASGNPLRWSAEVASAIALSYTDSDAALDRAGRLLRATPPYPSVRGRLHWLQGALQARAGEMTRAEAEYLTAAEVLRPVYGEHPAAYLEGLVGETAYFDGRLAEGLDIFVRAVPRITRHGDRRRLHAILATTGTALAMSGLQHAARSVYVEGLDNARRWGEDYALASSLRRWTTVARVLDPLAEFEVPLQEAWDATERIADPVIHELALGDLAVEQARIHLEQGYVSNSDLGALDQAIEVFEKLGSGFDTAQASLVASRIEAALGRWPEALEVLETVDDRASFRSSEARPVERPGALGSGLGRRIEFQRSRALLHAGRLDEALAAFERSRLAATGRVERQDRLAQRALTLAAEFDAGLLLLQEGDPALRFLVTPDGLDATELDVSSRQVRSLAEGFSALDAEARRDRLEQLGEWLLPKDWIPTRRLVVVADPDFDGVPFPGIVHQGTGLALVETTATAHAPHLHALLSGLDAAGFPQRQGNDPEATPGPTRGLGLVVASPDAVSPSLSAALEEAERVADVLGRVRERPELLLHPTAAEIAVRLPRAKFFHFAGHARSRPLDPYRRELLLAPDQSLDAERVLGLDLQGLHLAFVSSCDSASMVSLELPGPGFADFLLAAGVQQVVGTLWPVEDQGSLPLIGEFYSRLVDGESPIDALRGAQIRVLRETDANGAGPSSDWMGYRLIGSVLTPGSAWIDRR